MGVTGLRRYCIIYLCHSRIVPSRSHTDRWYTPEIVRHTTASLLLNEDSGAFTAVIRYLGEVSSLETSLTTN